MAIEKPNIVFYLQYCISPEPELFNGRTCYKLPDYYDIYAPPAMYVYWSISSNRWEASFTNFGVNPVSFLTNSTSLEPISVPPLLVWQFI